jgi:lipoyl(octanoyl) transferase
MSHGLNQFEPKTPALEAFLLGQIDFERVLALQQQLIVQCRERDDGQIVLLLCEHPSIVTVGRGGSAAEIATQSSLIRNRQIEVRWVNRGGGCMVHCPGQLAIYPIVPLQWHRFSIGEFLSRFCSGIIESLDDLNVQGTNTQGRYGVWGRTGQLAAIGVAVRRWVTYYGAYLNVCPPMGLFRLIESDPLGQTKMSCLVAERRGPVKMTTVRAELVRRLAENFGCDRYHLYTGHPLLRRGL